jgi:hypothetical protein
MARKYKVNKSVRPFVAVLLVAAAAVLPAACARASASASSASASPTAKGAPAEVILEIYNRNAYWVNAALVSTTATTPLGRVGARETRRWALPLQSGSIHVSATDSTGTRSQATTLELGKGTVVRWEVRE